MPETGRKCRRKTAGNQEMVDLDQIEQSATARIVFPVKSHLMKRILLLLLALFSLSPVLTAAPATAPTTQPTTQPAIRSASTQPATHPATRAAGPTTKLDEQATRRKLLGLTRKSIELLEK